MTGLALVALVAVMTSAVDGRRVRDIASINAVDNSNTIEDFGIEESLPRFSESIPNVTVTVGRDALLACVVDNLKYRKVAWVRIDTQTILSIHHNVITFDPRITLTHIDHRSWYLHVKDVQVSDRGWYMCQVNTVPMRSRQGYLQVVVPPSIEDKETSTDLVVREMTNVTLTCKATGFPDPYVMWRREDGEEIFYNGTSVSAVDGEVLHLSRISRRHMGSYLCIASNGVPPSISKRIQLRVQFPPMLSIPNQLEAAYLGQDVSLGCNSEAYPASINYWTTTNGDTIVSGDKYETVATDNGYNKYMLLKIRNMGVGDFGAYKCVAKNSLGETDGVIRLDEIPAPTLSTTAASFLTLVTTAKKRGRDRPRPLEQQELSGFGLLEEWRDPDYDDVINDYTLPSLGPHLARQPPGAYSNSPPPPAPHPTALYNILMSIMGYAVFSHAS